MEKYNQILFITLRPPAMLLNDETFKELKHNVHGIIGQVRPYEETTTMLLRTEFGAIKIIPHDSKKK